MNKDLGEKVRKWLQEPLPIHRHSPNPESCLTPLAQADLERKHTVTLCYIQQLESTISQVSKSLCSKENAMPEEILQAAYQLKTRLCQAERERDELFKYLPHDCTTCRFELTCERSDECNWGELWQWRGVCREVDSHGR